MKKETWKYMSLGLTVISIVLLLYSIVLPNVTGLNVTEMPLTSIQTTEGDIDDIVSNSEKIPFTVIPTGIGVEQYQDQVTGAVYVSNQLWWGQGVRFPKNVGGETRHINGYELGIGRHGTPTEPLYMGISDSTGLMNKFVRIIEIPPNALPDEDTLYFVGATFESQPYTATYMVLAAITDDDQTDGNYWMWGYTDQNPITNDNMVIWDFSNERWNAYVDGIPNFDDWDATYVVYSEEAGGGGGGDPPHVTIFINSYTTALGILTLLGGCFSGIKYGLVVGWI